MRCSLVAAHFHSKNKQGEIMLFTEAKELFINHLTHPQHQFIDTLSFIDAWFDYQPSAFTFRDLANAAHENQGSCKIFALAQLLNLDNKQALLCFGEHYRNLAHTPTNSHLNLRQLAKHGLTQIEFAHFPLQLKED